MLVALLAGRAAIHLLSVAVNRAGGAIPRSWQHVLWWGGLRGALSMALALGLNRNFPHRETLIAATFGVVLFSLLGQGGTIGALMKRLQVASLPPPSLRTKDACSANCSRARRRCTSWGACG